MSEQHDPTEVLKSRVGARIAGIQSVMYSAHTADDHRVPRVRAALAQWRRAAGKMPHDDPIAWTNILGPSPVGRDDSDMLLPEELQESRNPSEPSQWEWAAFTALTLYALHQQSQSTGMHVYARGGQQRVPNSVGYAFGKLARETGADSTKNRFDALLLARGTEAFLYQLRSAITQFRSKGIPLDYGLLAADLTRQRKTSRRQGMLLRWGRDFISGWRPAASGEKNTDDGAPAATRHSGIPTDN